MRYVTSSPRLTAALLIGAAVLSSSTASGQGQGPDAPAPSEAAPSTAPPPAVAPLARSPRPDPRASAEALTEPGAVSEAMRSSPELRASLLDWYEAQQKVLAEESRYIPVWSLDAGVTHTESPRLTSDSTSTSSSDSIDVGTGLAYTFPWGTGIQARLEGSRSSSGSVDSSVGQSAMGGPGYALSGRLSVTQPLLRGFGTDVGEQALRQAQLTRTAAEQTRDRTASETLRDVLSGYWQLWEAERGIEIDREALALAEQQRDDALRKLAAGALASADTLSFETRLAELEQSSLASESAWEQQSLGLEVLLGRDTARAKRLRAAAESVPKVDARARDKVLEAAVRASPAVLQAKSQLALAEEQAATAGESERPRLDLEAYFQHQGLGNAEVVPALEQWATFGAISAHVGAVFELPLSGSRHNAQRRAAAAAVESARERLASAEQQARADAAAELVKLDQAQRRVTLAESTAAIAEKNVDAQRKRYLQGDAIALEVRQAEDELRRARLSVEQARVDAIVASIRIDHATGLLLVRYAGLVPREPPQNRATGVDVP